MRFHSSLIKVILCSLDLIIKGLYYMYYFNFIYPVLYIWNTSLFYFIKLCVHGKWEEKHWFSITKKFRSTDLFLFYYLRLSLVSKEMFSNLWYPWSSLSLCLSVSLSPLLSLLPLFLLLSLSSSLCFYIMTIWTIHYKLEWHGSEH